MNRWVLIVFSLFFVFDAYASSDLATSNAKGCRELLNAKDGDGEWVHWKSRSELRDSNATMQAIKEYYLAKAQTEWTDDPNTFHSIKWCKRQVKALKALNQGSWTSLIAGSSSGTCKEVMEKDCLSVFKDASLPTTGTLHFLRDKKGQPKSFSIPTEGRTDVKVAYEATRLKKVLFLKDKGGTFYLLYDPREDTREISLTLMKRYEVDFIDDLEGRKFDFNKLATKTIELTDPETKEKKLFPLARPVPTPN